MNTLGRVDSFVFSLLVPGAKTSRYTSRSPSPSPTPRSRSTPTRISNGSNGRHTSPRSPSPPPFRRRRGRRPKPTTANIKVPPPSTPVFLRILLALWSILLSFWQSLVGETRAERVKRSKRAAALLRHLGNGILASADVASDGEGSASEDASSEDEPWVDPVTQAPPEKLDEPADDEFAPPGPQQSVTFNLESDSPTETPPSQNTRSRQARLLPNPMSTSLLDPSVPAVPASQTIMTTGRVPSPRAQTPFHMQKTLILDLDETLIHSTSRPLSYAASAGGGLLGLSFGGLFGKGRRREGHTVEVVLRGRSTTYHVYKRPYVDHFLKKVASWYTLVIFTASMPEYADPVIDWLDGGRGLFAKRLYREDCCLLQPGSYVKDLSLVEPDLSRVCFMDNSPISYLWNKANALPVEGWTSDPNDEALLHCIPVLDSLRFVNDVRRVLGIRGFW